MKYTVSINEKNRTITVERNGYKGVAKCCPTDRFDLQTGIELALERAKVAEANAKKSAPCNKPMGVMELVKALEQALPKGRMVVVGNGEEMTAEQKKWLAALAGVSAKCHCPCCDEDEDDDAYESGYDDGYADGYAEAVADYEDETDNAEVLNRIRDVLADADII